MSNSSLPGLEHRLGSRSRRSGLMIGVSIMTAIGILVGGFTVIFAVLDPLVSDFVGSLPEPTQVAVGEALAARNSSGDASGGSAIPTTEPTAESTAAPTPTPEPTAEATPPEDAFTPDYRVSAQQRINFREGPGVNFPTIAAIDPGTEVQTTGQSQATQNPAADLLTPGREWLEFRLEDGREGWIRDVAIAPINP
ncbi:MAG: hypothetical protein M3440_10780 [Chloroflexota bacterium]|nr:hypothetical protein [Chloroflexota bacterium]